MVAADDFGHFYELAMPQLVLFLIVAGATREEAEDAAQDAMVHAFQHWDTVTHPAAWVRVVAWRSHVTSAAHARQATDGARRLDWMNAATSDRDLAIFSEQVRAVLDALRQLPATQRIVMAWFYDGFTPREIAMALGKRPETVRSDLRHARSRLKRQLCSGYDDQHATFPGDGTGPDPIGRAPVDPPTDPPTEPELPTGTPPTPVTGNEPCPNQEDDV